MKKLVILILILTPIFSGAQSIYNNQIRVENTIPEQNGARMAINMKIDASALKLSPREVLILTPVLKSVDGSRELPAIMISGKNKFKSDRRTEVLSKKTAQTKYASYKIGSSELQNIRYSQSIPFERWMEYARLDFKEELIGCANCNIKSAFEIVGDSTRIEGDYPEKPSDRLEISYVTPPFEAVKSRNFSGEAFLDFQVGKSAILPEYRRNLQELRKIQNAIEDVQKNKYAEIVSIELKGYASPEGKYASNQKLSTDRANALKNYLSKLYSYPVGIFEVVSVAEDWDGLKRMVENSNLPDKVAILSIINNNSLGYDVKEARLKTMKSAWKTLMDDYFPLLRKVEYKLNYKVRSFNLDEGKEIVKTDPKEMNLNEMFLVANSYPKGSDDFNRIFDIAVKLYPSDPIANINAAGSALERKDLVSAERYLQNAGEERASLNNTGVLRYLQNNVDEAKEIFERAQRTGSEDAAKNLETIRLNEEYAEYLKQVRERIRKRRMLR